MLPGWMKRALSRESRGENLGRAGPGRHSPPKTGPNRAQPRPARPVSDMLARPNLLVVSPARPWSCHAGPGPSWAWAMQPMGGPQIPLSFFFSFFLKFL